MRIERSSILISLPSDVWTRIVFAAQESEDHRLRSLVEQAVHEVANVSLAPAPIRIQASISQSHSEQDR